MTNTVKTIKGTGIICKGNVNGNFEIVPMELFDYIQLKLITHTDLVIYVKLLQLYNSDYGYAFPTIPQLMNYTRIGSKSTIDNSLDRLEEVGLIQKSKANRGNNIYVVYKPLSKSEIYSFFPDKVEQLKEFENKLTDNAEHDKKRLQHHQQIKKEQQEQKMHQPKIQAKQIVPRVEAVTYDDDDMENLSLKEIKERFKAQGKW